MHALLTRVFIMKWELFSILICTIGFTYWNTLANQKFDYSVPLFFGGIFFLFFMVGRIIVQRLPDALIKSSNFFFSFLVGFFTVNTILLLMLYILPWSVKTDLWTIFIGASVLVFINILSPRTKKISSDNISNKSSFYTLLIIIIAVNFWIQSSVHAIQISDDVTIFKPWIDSFFHTSVINSIVNSQGFNSMQHLFLSNHPMPFYHFAIYIFPAELSSFTTTNAYQSYNSFLVPFGIVLTGMSAHIIISFIWGLRAGVAAVVGILLIPDSSEIGIHNTWLSYHWLQSIAPGGLYGVSLATLAWVFMLHGCKERLPKFILISYSITLLCVFYKFQIFFGNALLIWLFPALFYFKISSKVRIVWLTLCFSIYFVTIKLTQNFKKIPLINYDGSAAQEYGQLVLNQFENNWIKELFTTHIVLGESLASSIYWYVLNALMQFISTFGILGFIYFVLVVVLRKSIPLFILLLPFLVIVNYIIGTLTLAYDSNLIGNPEELIHRPFVWAYYLVCIWVFGALIKWIEECFSSFKTPKFVYGLIILFLFLTPLQLGKNVQNGPEWSENFVNTQHATGFVQSLNYIRDHSERTDLIQDSRHDPSLMISALSELQIFVSTYKSLDETDQATRIESLNDIQKMNDNVAIIQYFQKNKIRWFIAYPDDTSNWPFSMNNYIVYQRDGYKVYMF